MKRSHPLSLVVLAVLASALPQAPWEAVADARGSFRVGGGGGHFAHGGGNFMHSGANFHSFRSDGFRRGFFRDRDRNGFFGGFGGYGGGYVNPYGYNPYTTSGDPYGGYMQGTADIINSNGQYLIQVQQANLLNEQAKRAALDTKRATYEEWLWERANLPTLNDERERIQKEALRRSLNDPPATEIWSGKALNDILTNINLTYAKGQEGPMVPLDPDLLKNINVTTGKGPAFTGLLKDAGKLRWPVGLVTLPPQAESQALRDQIDNRLADAKKQAVQGNVDAGVLTELSKSIDRLSEQLVAHVGEFSFNDYTEAKRYVRQLEDAAKLLRQPDTGNYMTGKYAARGNSVKELVTYLRENGLSFAPAGGGEEAAYNALHQALVQYDLGATAHLSTTK